MCRPCPGAPKRGRPGAGRFWVFWLVPAEELEGLGQKTLRRPLDGLKTLFEGPAVTAHGAGAWFKARFS